MKAVFVACNQSMFDAVMDIMNDMGLRGFTGWEELIGCGTQHEFSAHLHHGGR